ncbi:MAG: formamidopyrimidine-DNA [Geobacteraceae bacterium]|nr:MAG: formamidopyrimidine-DNA [Geobacteraceae bacterium]
MPELPEVETTRRYIAPYVTGKRVERVIVRAASLRRPIPPELTAKLPGRTVRAVERRGKYLLLRCDKGTVILHLGMSGHLRIVPADTPPEKHDHLDIVLSGGLSLRFNDPRRFGLALWTDSDPMQHPLLAGLGPEPLEKGFDGACLYRKSRSRLVAAKQFIMNSRIVAGVGNIYANEALFRAGIHPAKAAGRLSRPQCELLADAVREVLLASIAEGGTSIRDFSLGEEKPGYFALRLNVYGRSGEPCPSCGAPIQQARQGGRATYFCRQCQK